MARRQASALAAALIAALAGAGAAEAPPAPAANPTEHALLLGAAHAGKRLVVVGERGAVFLSDDDGAAWRPAVNGSSATLTAVRFLDERRGWAVGHDAVIVGTEDGGETWKPVHSQPDLGAPLLDVWFRDASIGYAVGAYGLFLETQDGGGTWSKRTVPDEDRHFNGITGGPGRTLFIAGEAGALLRSDDGGRSWKALHSPYEGSYFGILALGGKGLLLYGLRGHAFFSDDLGGRWRPVETGGNASFMGGFASGPTAGLAASDGTVLFSSDGGRTFKALRPSATPLAGVIDAGGGLVVYGERGAARLEAAQ